MTEDQAVKQPHVVFILVDNTGCGDLGCYNGNVPTPRIDALAAEGLRCRNYNVEAECTPTRSAIMTGRMPVRSGTASVLPTGDGHFGLCPWEYTIANLLSDAGYSTALYGKWHLGHAEGRFPTNQGFDEWWGIPNSSDEAGYTAHPLFAESGLPAPQIWQGVKGQPSRPWGDFDLKTRPFMDEQIVQRTTAFIERQAARGKPFFIYAALTQIHPPMLVHPDFVGKSGGGIYSDVLTEMDYRVGQILDALERAGLADDTLVIFSSDNAAGHLAMGSGSNAPWRGDFFTPPFEGSHRAPAMVRWPGRIPAGTVTDEIFAAVDWLPTIAALVGEAARVPTDRPIDGLDSSSFLLGREPRSSRDAFIFYGPDGELMSVKWRTIKVIFRYQEGMTQPVVTPRFPLLYDLRNDPGERSNLWETRLDTGWMLAPAFQRVGALRQSMAQYPNIKPGQEFSGYS